MSSVPGKVFTFSWKIINYSLCSLENGVYLKSPVISIENFKNTKWFLGLYPNGKNKECSDFISIILYRIGLDDCKDDVVVSYAFEIIDPHGKILATTERKRNPFRKGYGRGPFSFLKIEELTNYMGIWKKDMIEIRCHVFDFTYKQFPVFYEARTEIQVKYLFNWEIIIPTLQAWSKKINCSFQETNSFDITVTAPDNKICMKIRIKKEQNLLELHKLKISVLNKKGARVCLQNSTYVFKPSEFEISFEKNQLEYETGSPYICTFTLECTIFTSDGSSTSTCISYSQENASGEESQQLATHRRTLQVDLKDLFLNKKHSDVKLRAGNEIIEVHKCLLSARSPVFSAMFDHGMVESETGIVDIPDVESETLRAFVEFLYTDMITNTDHDHALKLILVADKYQVSILKDECSKLLMSKLSPDNICEVVSVAEMVNQLDLKHYSINYIKVNKKSIISTLDWTEWVGKNMKLAIEILSKLSID